MAFAVSNDVLPQPSSPSAGASAADAKGYLLIAQKGLSLVRRVPLQGGHLIIGRNPSAQVVLDHSTVSRSHAELVFDPFGRWWVHDLGSTNGTHVNGTPIKERVLSPGDILEVGEFTLRLDLPLSRARMDSGYPLEAKSKLADGALGDEHDITRITVTPRAASSPQISAAHLSTVMQLGRRLMAIEQPALRLRTLCEFVTGDGFVAELASAIRMRAPTDAKMLSGPHSRSTAATLHLSRSVLETIWDTREPVLASGEPLLDVGVRRLSMAGALRQVAVIACPIRNESDELDLLYVEVPPTYGTLEWLTLMTLATEAYQQAELAWQVRRHVQAHAVIERELEMARQIQQALVPRINGLNGLELVVGFEPCRWVGGDYVDALTMPDGRMLLAVADVCGKGLQAALVASSLHTMVRMSVDVESSAVRLMDRLNHYLSSYLPAQSFVTMACVALDPATGALECVNAGHPPPVIVGTDGQIRRLQSEANVALGMSEAAMTVDRGHLGADELLVMYTDGLTDGVSFGDPQQGDELGRELLGVLASYYQAPLRTVHRAIVQLVSKQRGSHLAVDDLAFLIARRPAPGRQGG